MSVGVAPFHDAKGRPARIREHCELPTVAIDARFNEDVATECDSLFGGVSGIHNADEIQPVRATTH